MVGMLMACGWHVDDMLYNCQYSDVDLGCIYNVDVPSFGNAP